MRALDDWLWKGTFDPGAARRLPVWEGIHEVGEGEDLMQRTAAALGELGSLHELTREIEERSDSSSEEELRKVARAMLPVLDALDRILEYSARVENKSEEFSNWVKSVEGVSTRLHMVLERIGLTPLSALGSEVDLAVHDVVGMVPSKDYRENTVIEERQKGYYFRGRLLRDAKVVVAVPSKTKDL